MNLKNNATLAWGVAAVLALLLILTLVMGVDGKVAWNDVETRLRAECGDTSDKSHSECVQSLKKLEDVLIDLNRDLGVAVPGGTATTSSE